MFLYQNIILSSNIEQRILDVFMQMSKLDSQNKSKTELFCLARKKCLLFLIF